MRRWFFWTTVLVALAALLGGSAFAYLGYRETSGPDGAVKGYFAALARSDAPAALGFGALPSGSRDLLTNEVLAVQQKIAPLHDVHISDVARAGSEATVRFSYQLGFAGGNQEVTGSLRVVEHGSGWRLAQTAVATTVRLDQATDRLTFAGSSVPEGPTLLFPGALPVRFDTSYLMLDPSTADVQFGRGSTTTVRVEPTAAARTQLTADIGTQLAACVSAPPPSADCPLPSSRFVPGSLRGRLVGDVARKLTFRVSSDAAGTITTTGTIGFTGKYRRLAYDNVAQSRRGKLQLPVTASSYAVAPLSVRFASSA
jgi:hypothetical protein